MARPGKAKSFLDGVRKKPEPVTVNGYPVHLRPLTVKELIAFRDWYADNKDAPNANLELSRKLVAASVVDPESGSPMLDEDDVNGLDVATLEEIGGHIHTLNGMDDADPKAETPALNETSPAV